MKITPLAGEWSPRAALGNAMERVGQRDPVIVLWVDEDDNVCYSQSGMTRSTMTWLAARLNHAAMTGEDP